MKYQFASVAIGLPLNEPFDYAIPEHLQSKIQIGQRVFVPFRNVKRVGYVVNLPTQSTYKNLKSLTALIDHRPLLTAPMITLAQWISFAYGCSLGEAIDVMLPRLIRKGRGVADRPNVTNQDKKMSKKWLVVHDALQEKWPSILNMVQQMLDQKQTVLIIAPDVRMQEIIYQHVQSLSSSTIVMEKKSEKNELEQWQRAVQGQGSIVIGLRSHVFLPLPKLGLMMIFQAEHDALKSEQMPAYHVRDIACQRANNEKFHLVFSTVTPSVELWHRAQQEQWQQKHYPLDEEKMMRFIDLSNFNPEKSSIISVPLQNHMNQLFAEGKSMVLMVQRLGLLPIVERRIKQLYPQARQITYKFDSKRLPKRYDVIIATPALLREAGWFQCEHIAFLDADAELNRMDYQANHFLLRTMRVLRMMVTQCLWIQTRQPQHAVMKVMRDNNLESFYKEELLLRQDMRLPPFGVEIMMSLRCPDKERVEEEGERLYWLLSERAPEGIDVMAPQSDNIVQVHDKFRYPIGIMGEDLSMMHQYMKATVKEWKKKKGMILSWDVRI